MPCNHVAIGQDGTCPAPQIECCARLAGPHGSLRLSPHSRRLEFEMINNFKPAAASCATASMAPG